MKLRNKKTGEIENVCLVMDKNKIAVVVANMPLCGNSVLGEYNTLAELNKEWEDYDPQPLIKNEKIRKAVRAWAEMNDIRFIHMCSRKRKENARIVGQNALGRTFTMEIDNEYEIRVRFKDYKECYTIAELCGEEEE